MLSKSNLKNHLAKERLKRILKYPPNILIKKVIRRFSSYLAAFLCLPLACCMYFMNWRIQLIDTSRIGHFSITLLCTINDERLNFRYINKILLPINQTVQNNHLLKYLPKKYCVLHGNLTKYLVCSMAIYKFLTLPADEYVIQPRPKINAFNILGVPHKHFYLNEIDDRWFDEQIATRYPLKTDWFVVVNYRTFGTRECGEIEQDYRNCELSSYETAIDYIIESGGTVFVVSHDTKANIQDRPFLYDVRSTEEDRLHLCLSARCKFFLGCSSGIAFLATFFGKPVATANLIPVTTMPFTDKDLGQHKHIIHIESGKILDLKEALRSSVVDAFVSSMYGKKYWFRDNDNQEIASLAKSMNSQLNEDKIDKVKVDFQSGDYAYGAASHIIDC